MSEFIKDETSIRINAEYAEAYIPFDLFDDPEKKQSAVASLYGNGIQTMGLFNMRFYNSDNDSRDSAKLRTFKYPNTIITYPSSTEIVTIKLEPDMEEDKYVILKYYKNDKMMNNEIIKTSQNCEKFLDLLIKGKLPKGLSYTDLLAAWVKNFEINDVDPGVPLITMQFMLSENCRDKNNPILQFRKVAGKNKSVSLKDYVVMNMVNVAANTSVMSALAFERFGDMLTTSLNMTKSGVKQNKSPLEKVLTM